MGDYSIFCKKRPGAHSKKEGLEEVIGRREPNRGGAY